MLKLARSIPPLCIAAAALLHHSAAARSQVVTVNQASGAYATTAVFAVSLAEPTEAAYQWFKDGAAIPAASAATLSIASPQLGDAGAYHVIVSNAVGAAASRPAGLSIVAQPNAVSQLPSDRLAAPGETVEFRAAATGKGISYQWFHNGTALRRKTSRTLTLDSVTAAHAGTYQVRISSKSGPIAVGVAILTVQ